MKIALAMLFVPGLAIAKPITSLHVTDSRDTMKLGYTTSEVFRVVGPTPILDAQLNIALNFSASLYNTAQSQAAHDLSCVYGIMTDAFASFYCRGGTYGPDGGGTAQELDTNNYLITGDDLRAVNAASLFGADFKTKGAGLKGMRDEDPCTIDPTGEIFVSDDGVTFFADEMRCMVSWDVLAPMLVKDSVLRRLVGPNAETPEDAPENPRAGWAKAKQRFTAEAGGILDHATDLVWAAADNGADIDHAGALKFAAEYRGGGFADWRLPTEEEIETASEKSAAHRSKADCTKGKNALLLTPLIKLTCGLAWTTSAVGKGFVGFGFISGTPRVSKATEKKNYRALVVRDLNPKAKK